MSVMLRWEHQLSDKLAFQQSEDQHLQFEEVVLPNPSMSIPTVSENCAPSGHDGLQAPLAEFIIEYGGCRIHIGSHFNEQNLAKVMRVLQHA